VLALPGDAASLAVPELSPRFRMECSCGVDLERRLSFIGLSGAVGDREAGDAEDSEAALLVGGLVEGSEMTGRLSSVVTD
jgi:hypothetical protein